MQCKREREKPVFQGYCVGLLVENFVFENQSLTNFWRVKVFLQSVCL